VSRVIWAALMLCSGCCIAFAQPKKPLADFDIVSMIKSGLSEQTIVLAIQRGSTAFDTSPDTLTKLKKDGVSDNLLNAISRSAYQSTAAAVVKDWAAGNDPGAVNTLLFPNSQVSRTVVTPDGGYITTASAAAIQTPADRVAARRGTFATEPVNIFSKIARAIHSEEFWWQTGHVLAAGADLGTTRAMLDSCKTCFERDPIFGARKPGLGRQLAIGVPASAVAGYAVHRGFKRGKNLGRVLSEGLIGTHSAWAVSNGKYIGAPPERQ